MDRRTALLYVVASLGSRLQAPSLVPPSVGTLTQRDNEAVLVALKGLLVDGRSDPFMPPVDRSKPLLFDPRPNCHPMTVDTIIELSDKKLRRTLASPELERVREAAEHLSSRTPCSGEFEMAHPRIQLRRGDPPDARIFDLTTDAHLPGYSRDGRTALVLLGIPWSTHGAVGTYVLVLKQGGWRVRERDFVRYV